MYRMKLLGVCINWRDRSNWLFWLVFGVNVFLFAKEPTFRSRIDGSERNIFAFRHKRGQHQRKVKGVKFGKFSLFLRALWYFSCKFRGFFCDVQLIHALIKSRKKVINTDLHTHTCINKLFLNEMETGRVDEVCSIISYWNSLKAEFIVNETVINIVSLCMSICIIMSYFHDDCVCVSIKFSRKQLKFHQILICLISNPKYS